MLRLRHFIEFQNRLAGDADVDPGHLRLGLRRQLAQPPHRLVIQLVAPGTRRDDENPPLRERDINLLLGLLARVEQRGNAG